MTDKIALYVGLLIAALIGIDLIFMGGANLYFLARKGMEFIEWIAFWR